MFYTPFTKESFKQHMTYYWWKYVLAVVLLGFATDLIFTVTEYRPPENKKIELYIYGYADEDGLDKYMEEIRMTKMQDMEQMNCSVMISDEVYGDMVLTTHLAAGEGDVYILSKDKFIGLAESGALLSLENDQVIFDVLGQDPETIKSGWRKENETGQYHLFGIPTDKLPGLNKYGYFDDCYICIIINNGNDENVKKFFVTLCTDMSFQEEKPESN